MKLVLPNALKPGDVIGVVAPAGVVDRVALRRGVKVLQEMGFKVMLGRYVFSKESYFAGKHLARAKDLNAMIRHPEVRGIVCARGGYGAAYLIPHLDLKLLRRHPKVIMGSSDVTVLLNWINARTGMVTFHGPMVATNFSKGLRGIQLDSLKHALLRSGGSGRIVRWRISLRKKDVIRSGRASGKLVGGCLTLLVSTLGTRYEIETRDSILFLEDVNEAPYRVDRMLKQLEDAGKFEHVRGVVFGDMLNCVDSKNRGNNVRRVISSLSGRFRGPIVMGLSSGHTSHPIITLPIGARATLHLRGAPALIIEEATSR